MQPPGPFRQRLLLRALLRPGAPGTRPGHGCHQRGAMSPGTRRSVSPRPPQGVTGTPRAGAKGWEGSGGFSSGFSLGIFPRDFHRDKGIEGTTGPLRPRHRHLQPGGTSRAGRNLIPGRSRHPGRAHGRGEALEGPQSPSWHCPHRGDALNAPQSTGIPRNPNAPDIPNLPDRRFRPLPCPGEAPVLLAPVRLRCLPRVLIFSPGSHAPGLGSLPPHPNHSRWDPAPAARSHRDPRAGIGFVMNPPAPVRL